MAAAQEAAPYDSSADASAPGEIIVTARRREEKLLTTPVSATVLSGGDLLQQSVRSFQDLRGAVSNLELVPLLSGGTSFTIRGIGQTFNQVNSDAKAGFYVDEMYVSRLEGNDLYFYDIANLQVLKGPQGTLFGKNTTAGAVLLTTQRPTDRFEGFARVRVGSYDRVETEGAINVPLAEGLYGRLSFRTQNVDGFIKHVVDDKGSGDIDNQSVRLQLRAEQGPLTADLLGEINRSRTDGGASI
ncbi:MAG: TonB-dependent receptor, partial [Oxalobacteraceae bacterium]